MLIPVMYKNGNHDQVKDFTLPKLIEDAGIIKFKRSGGWVTVSTDRIRDMQKTAYYSGKERRQNQIETADLIEIF